MSQSESGGERVSELLAQVEEAAAPARNFAELKKRFLRLTAEEQAAVVEELIARREAPAPAKLLDELFTLSGVALPALARIARAQKGREGEETVAGQLERWVTLCEGEEAEWSPEEYFHLPKRFQDAVRDHLALWSRTDILHRLKEAAPDKKAGKELAKILHRLRSAGIPVTMADGSRQILLTAEREDFVDEAYLLPPDSEGYFFVYLYRTLSGRNNVAILLVNDRKGVKEFELYELPRHKWERILASTRRNPHAVVARVEPAFARQIVKKAEAAGIKLGIHQNDNYLARRRALGIADEAEGPYPLWNRLDRNALQAERGLVFQSAQLLEHRLFEDWRLISPEEGKLVSEYAQIKHSPLALTPTQQKERVDELFQKEASRLVEEIGREVWSSRLLLCAYFFVLMGEEEAGRMAAATALALESPDEPVPPFFRELLRRTVRVEIGEKERRPGEREQGGIIIT